MVKKHWLALAPIVLAAACAKYMIAPPAVTLPEYGSIGLVTFTVENAKGDLDEMGTQLFLQEVMRAQRVPVVECGKPEAVLAKIGKSAFDLESAKAIGEAYGVRAFFLGDIKISKVKPQVDVFRALTERISVRTKFDIAVGARLISAENGATIWTDSILREGTTGFFSMGRDEIPDFGIRDKNDAVTNLLREIMYQLTWDFRPTRQRVR